MRGGFCGVRRAASVAALAAFMGCALGGALAPSNPAPAPAPTEDIRDIRGPKTLLPASFLPLMIAGGVLLGLGIFTFLRWRRRRSARPLLPFEIALQRLEEARALMSSIDAAEFSVRISDAVRSYIELRFGVTVTRRTTEEFLHDLLESDAGSLARHRTVLGHFLQRCDFVKFAGTSLTYKDLESLYASARTFVMETAAPDAELPLTEAHAPLPST